MRYQDHFLLGPWQVFPHRNTLVCGPTVVHLEPKVMHVLLRLAEHPGAVVTREELIADVWMGTSVNDDVATRAISALRKALQDNPRNPTFSHDAERLVGEHWTVDMNVWRLPLDQAAQPMGSPEVLVASTRLDMNPHASPDGAHLVFISNRSGNNEVWIS